MENMEKLWNEKVPEWSFGKLMTNVFINMRSEGRDPASATEEDVVKYLKEYLGKETITVWRVYGSFECFGFVTEPVVCSEPGVFSEPVKVIIPDGFHVEENVSGQIMFFKGNNGYDLSATNRWDPESRPVLVGSDELVALEVV